MTRPAADSVKVFWTGSGTGTMNLGAAATGFQGFGATLNGQIVSYLIEHTNGNERETGIGTYTSSGNTLTRDLVTFSTAGAPTKVTFSSGIKLVRLSLLSLDVVENRASADPSATDDINSGYIAGRARWFNIVTKQLFFCVDHTPSAAQWREIGSAGGGAVLGYSGDTLGY